MLYIRWCSIAITWSALRFGEPRTRCLCQALGKRRVECSRPGSKSHSPKCECVRVSERRKYSPGLHSKPVCIVRYSREMRVRPTFNYKHATEHTHTHTHSMSNKWHACANLHTRSHTHTHICPQVAGDLFLVIGSWSLLNWLCLCVLARPADSFHRTLDKDIRTGYSGFKNTHTHTSINGMQTHTHTRSHALTSACLLIPGYSSVSILFHIWVHTKGRLFRRACKYIATIDRHARMSRLPSGRHKLFGG